MDAEKILYMTVRGHDKEFEVIVAPNLNKEMLFMKVRLN